MPVPKENVKTPKNIKKMQKIRSPKFFAVISP